MVNNNDVQDIGVEKIHKKRVSSMSRRRLMNSLVSLGMTAGSAAYITTEDVKGASSDQIPIVIRHDFEDPEDPTSDRTPVKKYVNSDWYNNLKRAQNVRRELTTQFDKTEGIISGGTLPPKSGGENAKIKVNILENKLEGVDKHVDDVIGEVPESKDGVEIDVEVKDVNKERNKDGEQNKDSEVSDDNIGIESPDAVEIGQRLYTEKGWGSSGTAGGRVYWYTQERFITNHHLWHGEDPVSNSVPVYDSNGDKLGNAVRGDCEDDWIVFSPEGNVSNTLSGGMFPDRLTGDYTQDGVSDLAKDDKTVTKIGAKTGRTSGEVLTADYFIHDLGQVDGCFPRYEQVAWQDDSDAFDDGDSGSVAWHSHGSDSDDNAAVCLNAGISWGFHEVFGCGTWAFPDYEWG